MRIYSRRSNGRFRKPFTLRELGFDVADGPATCSRCGETWNPVLRNGLCPKCGTAAQGTTDNGDGSTALPGVRP